MAEQCTCFLSGAIKSGIPALAAHKIPPQRRLVVAMFFLQLSLTAVVVHLSRAAGAASVSYSGFPPLICRDDGPGSRPKTWVPRRVEVYYWAGFRWLQRQ